jgi:hypothetical protein
LIRCCSSKLEICWSFIVQLQNKNKARLKTKKTNLLRVNQALAVAARELQPPRLHELQRENERLRKVIKRANKSMGRYDICLGCYDLCVLLVRCCQPSCTKRHCLTCMHWCDCCGAAHCTACAALHSCV